MRDFPHDCGMVDTYEEAVKAKKEAFKNWRTTGNEVDKDIYKEHRKTAKISVTKAKYLAYEDMYEKLNTREGQTLIYKLANTGKGERWT